MSTPEDWRCPDCQGTGKFFECEACHGNGWVEDPSDGGTMTCPECLDDPCETCGGTGELPLPTAKTDAG